MSETAPTPTREDQMLAELAELDLALARKVHAAAMAATEPEAVGALARTYQRVARSLRQTLALKARVAAERARAEAQRAAQAARGRRPVRGLLADLARRRTLRDAVHRVAWDEYERGELSEPAFEQRIRKAMEIIETISLRPGFEREDLDEQVQLLCETLELDPEIAARWRSLPEDLGPADGEDGDDEDAAPDRPRPSD